MSRPVTNAVLRRWAKRAAVIRARNRSACENLARTKLLEYAARLERAEPYMRNSTITKTIVDIVRDMRADADDLQEPTHDR